MIAGMSRDEIMKQWDRYSGMLRRNEGGSTPRDWFENLLDLVEEDSQRKPLNREP